VLGTFMLTPTPREPISHERCVVAVALADQLGAALAAQGDRGQPRPEVQPATAAGTGTPARW
jgi:hypothetical protein